jgi:hypothetical protein
MNIQVTGNVMRWKPSWKWFEITLIILYISLHLYIALSPSSSLLNWYSNDDAFYYFKVATNITGGHGVTFDGINRTNGFHPLWMLVCIPVFWLVQFNLFLPLRLLVMVSALLNAGTGIFIFRLLRRFLSNETAAITALIWLFLPSIYGIVVQNGMETCISAFFLVLLLYLVVKWRQEKTSLIQIFILGLVAGLAILARLDNIFVVALLGMWFALGTASAYLRTVVVGDLALIFISGLLSYYIRLHPGADYAQNSTSLPWLIGISFLVKPVLLFLFGMYELPGKVISLRTLKQGALAISAASVIIGAALVILQKFHVFLALPRLVIVIDWIITLAGIFGLRVCAFLLVKQFGETSQEKAKPFPSWKYWKAFLSRASGYNVLLVALLGGYMLWNIFFVGTAMPVSGQIKHWWSTINSPYGSVNTTIPELLGFIKSNPAWGLALSPVHINTSSSPILVKILVYSFFVLLIISIISEWKWAANLLDRLGLFVLFSGLYAQILSYTSTGYIHIRSWYWVGEILFTLLCFSVLLESLHMKIAKPGRRAWIRNLVMIGIGLFVLISFIIGIWQEYPHTTKAKNEQHEYITEARALEENTETGALIGMTGGGTVAYFIRGRTIVNLDGLINSPRYFDLLKIGQGSIFLDQIHLDYVFAAPDIEIRSDLYRELLFGRLNPLISLGDNELSRYIPAENSNP